MNMLEFTPAMEPVHTNNLPLLCWQRSRDGAEQGAVCFAEPTIVWHSCMTTPPSCLTVPYVQEEAAALEAANVYAMLESTPLVDGVITDLRRTQSILDDLDESLKVAVFLCVHPAKRNWYQRNPARYCQLALLGSRWFGPCDVCRQGR